MDVVCEVGSGSPLGGNSGGFRWRSGTAGASVMRRGLCSTFERNFETLDEIETASFKWTLEEYPPLGKIGLELFMHLVEYLIPNISFQNVLPLAYNGGTMGIAKIWATLSKFHAKLREQPLGQSASGLWPLAWSCRTWLGSPSSSPSVSSKSSLPTPSPSRSSSSSSSPRSTGR